jgi:hypothetical protein
VFKVKTDFGYVLVEKDTIASIIPDTPADPAAAKADIRKKPDGTDPKTAKDTATVKKEKAAAIAGNANAHPEVPTATRATADAHAPAVKTAGATPKTTVASIAAPPPPPKEEPAASREEIQGNLYINHEFGFRMYKAPSWQIGESMRSRNWVAARLPPALLSGPKVRQGTGNRRFLTGGIELREAFPGQEPEPPVSRFLYQAPS